MIAQNGRWLALAGVAIAAFLVTAAPAAEAARSVYFADPWAGEIAQFGALPGGGLSPLDPGGAPAFAARRLAMTPEGENLYATAAGAVLQYDVAPDGRLTPKDPAALPVHGQPHSIAVGPEGDRVYVTDHWKGTLRSFTVGAGGRLEEGEPVAVGTRPTGVAVSPDGASVYVLAKGAIVRFAVAADGSLAPGTSVTSLGCALADLALTPDGRNLYATAADGRVLAFDVDADGALAAKQSQPIVDKPVGIAIAPDGRGLFVAARDWGGARVLAFTIGANGELAPADPQQAAVASPKLWYLAASPDGRSLYAAGGDGFLFDIGPLAAKQPPSVDLALAVGVVVSPNQSPLASFTTAPAAAGEPLRFDASGASDPDGTIVRYDWDFGDGVTLPDGGPTPEHVYSSPGTYTVVLTVVDNEGASTATIFTGGTVLGRGTPGARASREIEVLAAAGTPTVPPPIEPVLPPPPQQPQPDLGETLVAQPLSGSVRVRLPGSGRFQPLRSVRELVLGSTIDARRGRVRVLTERKRRGRFQNGVFQGGVFGVRQRKADDYVTELVLRGALGRCQLEGARAAAAGKRRLWGNASGRFRTRGRYSSGIVRGTRWLVEDRCDGTLTAVREGQVAVRDFVRHTTIVLEAGERYLARP